MLQLNHVSKWKSLTEVFQRNSVGLMCSNLEIFGINVENMLRMYCLKSSHQT